MDENRTEISSSIEREKTVSNAWLFDVDGVVTHPEQKRVTEPKIITEMAVRLQKGEPVALVTGRSVDFMREKVINLLRVELRDPSLLQNFLAVGEKGGVMLSFDQSGNEIEQIDESITVPPSMQDEARTLVEQKYSKAVFFDKTKRTMISIEMHDGFNLDEFKKIQPQLDQDLENLVARYNQQASLKIDSTTIATDIQNNHVGKDFAAGHVLEWLRERGIKPARYIAFGDSLSDLEMAQRIHEDGLPVEFIFVGNKAALSGVSRAFPIKTTQSVYNAGTSEYLNQSV